MKRKTAPARATGRRTYANPTARAIGDVNGRKVYRVPVKVRLNNSRDFSYCDIHLEVLAPSARDAANWARDQYALRAETEIFAFGPKGGEVYRYIGHEGAIWASLCALDRAQQSLALDK